MKVVRANTMYNLQPYTNINNNIIECGVYELQVDDITGKNIATIILQKNDKGFTVHAVSTIDECQVVRDHVSNTLKRKFLKYVLGIDFGKCYDMHVIKIESQIIAKITVNELTHALKVKVNPHYIWHMKTLPHTPVPDSDILNAMGIDHDNYQSAPVSSGSNVTSTKRTRSCDEVFITSLYNP
jgi:hypothetical protein